MSVRLVKSFKNHQEVFQILLTRAILSLSVSLTVPGYPKPAYIPLWASEISFSKLGIFFLQNFAEKKKIFLSRNSFFLRFSEFFYFFARPKFVKGTRLCSEYAWPRFACFLKLTPADLSQSEQRKNLKYPLRSPLKISIVIYWGLFRRFCDENGSFFWGKKWKHKNLLETDFGIKNKN